ncbi:MAG: hypothetical protein DMF43_00465 [Verrucomicrobia bacterium]|nr:MAG: hypothetical protein DMF43_00465 [Verrucomicrobiota bacterium]
MGKHGAGDRAIHEHGSGWLNWIGQILTGPLALVLRLFSLLPFAAISFLIGALGSRFGWRTACPPVCGCLACPLQRPRRYVVVAKSSRYLERDTTDPLASGIGKSCVREIAGV